MIGIAALGRIEETGAEQAFEQDQDEGDGQHRGGQNLHPGGGVKGPDKQRQPPPAHPLGAQAMDGGDEIDAGQDRGEAENEDGEDRQRHVGGRLGAEGNVEGPAGVGKTGGAEQRGEGQQRPDDVEPPGKQVEAGEGDVVGAEVDRQEEVAEDGRNPGMMKRKIMITPCRVNRAL
jgi:hypothetical protein